MMIQNTKRLKTNDSNQTYLWHCHLGHISKKRISKLHKDGLLDPFVFEQMDVCESCLLGKMTKAPFSWKGERASDLLGLIHSDVCGPINTQAKDGFQYFITVTDDYSSFGYVCATQNPKPLKSSRRRILYREFRRTPKRVWNCFTAHST